MLRRFCSGRRGPYVFHLSLKRRESLLPPKGELNVSEATIKAHVSAILQKLNVSSRTQAVIAASRIDGVQAAEQ